jgi:hypothetical protein
LTVSVNLLERQSPSRGSDIFRCSCDPAHSVSLGHPHPAGVEHEIICLVHVVQDFEMFSMIGSHPSPTFGGDEQFEL